MTRQGGFRFFTTIFTSTWVIVGFFYRTPIAGFIIAGLFASIVLLVGALAGWWDTDE